MTTTESTKKRVLSFLILAVIVGVITFLVPMSIGLGAKVFSSEEILQQFSFYLAGGIFLFLLTLIFVIELFVKKDDEKYGNSIFFASPGRFPAIKFFKRFSNFQLAFLSIIFFMGLGLFVFIFADQTSFVGSIQITQEFTKTAQMLFSLSLVPGSENIGLALVLGFSLMMLRIWARKVNMDKTTFMLIALIVIPMIIGGGYWGTNHLLRYGAQDVELLTTVGFGIMMSLLVVLTGSFVVGWIMHIANNLFITSKTLFASDSITAFTIFILLALIVFYVVLYRKKGILGRKKQERE